MNKTEFVTSIANKTGMSKKDAEKAFNAFVDTLTESLIAKEKTVIPGIGTFSAETRNARTGRNPHTGEIIEIEESLSPKFKASSTLKKMLNPEK